MLKNYLKIAFRNLLRNKAFSAINITGLAVGMASAMLILLWMHHEFSYDKFHRNRDHLYAVWNRGEFDGQLRCWSFTPKVLGPALKQEYPEISEMSRHFSRWYVTRAGERKMSTQAMITETSFFRMFDFPFIQGDPQTALADVNSIVVTEKMALKMFGTTQALEKIITIDQNNYKVTGIMKDLPSNTAFAFDFILPWEHLKMTNQDDANWANSSVMTYLQLKPGSDTEAFESKIKDAIIRYSANNEDKEIFLHPVSKWHLYSKFENGQIAGGRIETVRLFGVIAVFILLIACINFMNLSTARSEKRAKEVGIRKTAGANKGLLISQFIGESILLALIAGILGLLLVFLTVPWFSQLTGRTLPVSFYRELWFWPSFTGFVLLTGALAGSYPAFFLSSFQPVAVLKGTFKGVNNAINPRKVLVVVQFSFAITLIVSTLIVSQQIRFAQERDTGYKQDHILYHWMTGDLYKNYTLVKNELIRSGIATSVTKTSSPLTMVTSDTWGLEWKGKNPAQKIDFERFSQDEGLVTTAGLKLIQGRDLDLNTFPSDSGAMLLNESAAKAMGFQDPIGQIIRDEEQEYHVVGVVKDFVLGSPYMATKPMIIQGANSFFNVIHIKMNGANELDYNVKKISEVFRKYNPDYPFEHHFVDEDYAQKFADTKRIGLMTAWFAGLTIFISCLGLFGLAAYMAENRIKEIGVRKVLGASVTSVVALLSREFVVLVLLAIAVATPVAWYAMESWLNDFVYRINIQWWTFALAGLLAIVVSLSTVAFQAINAATIDPVKSLRRN